MKKAILITTLIAGTMDLSAACLQSYFMNGVMPSRVLKYIASGIFGNDAYNGGLGMMIWGLLVHYFIVFACTATFFWLYSKWHFLEKSILLNSILVALVAWIVTTQIIVPLSKVKKGNFDISHASIALAILIICIGFPIAYSAKQYYKQKEQ
ncbi:MAG: hypothetical protein ABIO60_08230 [Aquaticitalea sp.]